jgi:DNA repair photolyase
MNPTIGCFYGCHYCFSPKILNRSQQEFFTTVKIKGNFPDKIDKKLGQLSYLPQHFKRVQINESNDIYHPRVFHGMKKLYKRDIMLEIYDVFQRHWTWDNKWMIHVLTKSHLILEHLNVLKDMKEMVQVEISICSPDDNVIRKFERETPSLDRRLKTIETLSNAGIFVRVMAMPFIGSRVEAEQLRTMCFNAGAQGFKHKGLNYFSKDELDKLSWDDILAGKLTSTSGRADEIWDEFIVKSGEFVPENGDFRRVDVLWSNEKNWTKINTLGANFTTTRLRVVDCGYQSQTKVEFGYII